MLWVVFGFMLLAAALSIAWPLYREEQKLTGRSVIAMVALLGGLFAASGPLPARWGIGSWSPRTKFTV